MWVAEILQESALLPGKVDDPAIVAIVLREDALHIDVVNAATNKLKKDKEGIFNELFLGKLFLKTRASGKDGINQVYGRGRHNPHATLWDSKSVKDSSKMCNMSQGKV
jgi:hypothetical protein